MPQTYTKQISSHAFTHKRALTRRPFFFVWGEPGGRARLLCAPELMHYIKQAAKNNGEVSTDRCRTEASGDNVQAQLLLGYLAIFLPKGALQHRKNQHCQSSNAR